MADNIIGDIYTHFDKALSGFYEGAASGISAYVIPVAWIVLGICVLIWCYLLMQGKVAVPATDWLLKFIGFMEAGTTLEGEYAAGVQPGQHTIFTLWTVR